MRDLPDVVRAERLYAPVAGYNAGNPDIRRDGVSSSAVPYFAAGRARIVSCCSRCRLVLGFIVVIAFSMLVYISAFYTLDVSGTRIIVAMVAEFCSGSVIPSSLSSLDPARDGCSTCFRSPRCSRRRSSSGAEAYRNRHAHGNSIADILGCCPHYRRKSVDAPSAEKSRASGRLMQ